jgi:hypothetical protein
MSNLRETAALASPLLAIIGVALVAMGVPPLLLLFEEQQWPRIWSAMILGSPPACLLAVICALLGWKTNRKALAVTGLVLGLLAPVVLVLLVLFGMSLGGLPP